MRAAAEIAEQRRRAASRATRNAAISYHGLAPCRSISISTMVRKIANGSLIAGFDLQRRADARPQPQPLGVQQEEHGRGVGRGDDGADQQRLGPAEAERIHRRRRGERGGHQHADGRQQARRPDHVAEGLEAGAQPAVEQDQRQRHRADGVGEPHVVELDAERPGLARQHADAAGTPAATARRSAAPPGSTGCRPGSEAQPSRMPRLTASSAAIAQNLPSVGRFVTRPDRDNAKSRASNFARAIDAVQARRRGRRAGGSGVGRTGRRRRRRDGRDHRLGDLVLAHDHVRGAVLHEVLDLGLGMRPRDDRQRRVELARLLDDLAALERIRDRDQDAARRSEIGGPDDVGIGAVAGDGLARPACP